MLCLPGFPIVFNRDLQRDIGVSAAGIGRKPDLNAMKIVVTGCNGRVGKRVVLLALKRGYLVTGADHAPFSDDLRSLIQSYEERFAFKQVELENYERVLELFSESESNAVIHLAAIRDPSDYGVHTHNSNVVISWNVLRACAELGINRVAQASSVNVITMLFSVKPIFNYFPLDENHPCEPDEPYGLSKVICELQANTLTRRYPDMRIASLRLHWSVPEKAYTLKRELERAAKDLWGYVHHDSAADAFLLGITCDTSKWPSRHEAMFVAAPEIARDGDSGKLKETFPDVLIKDGFEISGNKGFYDCRKAEKLLGWRHRDSVADIIKSVTQFPRPLHLPSTIDTIMQFRSILVAIVLNISTILFALAQDSDAPDAAPYQVPDTGIDPALSYIPFDETPDVSVDQVPDVATNQFVDYPTVPPAGDATIPPMVTVTAPAVTARPTRKFSSPLPPCILGCLQKAVDSSGCGNETFIFGLWRTGKRPTLKIAHVSTPYIKSPVARAFNIPVPSPNRSWRVTFSRNVAKVPISYFYVLLAISNPSSDNAAKAIQPGFRPQVTMPQTGSLTTNNMAVNTNKSANAAQPKGGIFGLNLMAVGAGALGVVLAL
ncbi:hypothetical protein NP233_g277 [Leucocoprinus birnbaumii]|uniref:NAD-dependent epimerase/dehydratase domain-containing protein n=1 Tax=Leucocoprinus birnbaumii TaxID=56174 RepID=A0AAD5W2K8_9AGAR|nr:hypothetical protein NP233_g277 [Leucocoprinus birnbaumii]